MHDHCCAFDLGGGEIATIRIITIQYDPVGADVTNEWVLFENLSPAAVSMAGWTLTDRVTHLYTFPAGFSLAAGTQVFVWTRAGADTATDLFWGRSQAVWNNDPGDVATLRDASGSQVTRYSYRSFRADPKPVGLGGGGSIYAPVVSPHASGTIFVSCDMNGLYRTVNSGQDWHMLDNRVVYGTKRFTVAYDPTRPGHLVASHPVQGLQESFDDGIGWGPVAPPLPVGLTVTAAGIPRDAPERLLVGTSQGLYRFDPAQAAWLKVNAVGDDVVGFVFPTSTAPYFVATVNDVYSSTDGSQTWVSIGGSLPARPAGPFETDVSPGDPAYLVSRIRGFGGGAAGTRYVLYASIATQSSDVQKIAGTRLLTAGGVYSYDSTVGSWKRATPDIDVTLGDQGGGTPIPRFERLGIADATPDTVYVSVINTTYDPMAYKGTFAGSAWTWNGVFRWTTAPVNVDFGWFETATPVPRHGFGLGGAAHGLATAPGDTNVGIFTNEAAVYVTTDGGAGAPQYDWYQRFTRPSGARWLTNGLDVTTVWHYKAHPGNPSIHLMCNTDIGLARSTDGGSSWESIVYADIGGANQNRWDNFYELAFEYPAGKRIWAAVSMQHDIPHETQLKIATLGAGAVLASDDDGASWFKVNTTPLPGPVVSIINENQVLYASVWGSGVWESADRGKTWGKKGTFPPGVSTRCARIDANGSTLYCSVSADHTSGFVPGGLYSLSLFGATQWQPVAAPGKPTLTDAVAPAKLAPVDFGFGRYLSSGQIYVCTQSVQGSNGGGGAYQFSASSGWERLPIPFPLEYGDGVQAFAPYCVWATLRPPRLRLYVTSSHGIWYTDDAMKPPAQQTWSELRAIPFLSTQRLEFDFLGRITYVTTFGGGVWRVTLSHLVFSGG